MKATKTLNVEFTEGVETECELEARGQVEVELGSRDGRYGDRQVWVDLDDWHLSVGRFEVNKHTLRPELIASLEDEAIELLEAEALEPLEPVGL